MEPESCQYDRGVIEATPAQFDEQMGWLRRRFHVTELEEVRAYAKNPSLLRRCSVLVSFDDGYRDNVEVALPILTSHGLRAAFFLPTAFVDTTRLAWWDQIAFMVRQSSRDQIVLHYPREITFCVKELSRESTIQSILGLYKHEDTRDTERFLRDVEEACGVDLPSSAPERLFMDWTEAMQLARAGMGLGSHTHTHEVLAKGTRSQQLQELCTSRDLLREKVGVTPVALAYPVGSQASFSATTQACLREAGYELAFSYYGGVNTPDAIVPFDLKRLSLDHTESLSEYRLRTAFAGATAKALW
jgi:peptidoglycan/xylan/chitin deacetylase (PgdA/CDA1 family)